MALRLILKEILTFSIYFIFYFYFFKILIIYFERGEGRERETSMYGCLSSAPHQETWTETQACALTGNGTSDSLVHRLSLIHI